MNLNSELVLADIKYVNEVQRLFLELKPSNFDETIDNLEKLNITTKENLIPALSHIINAIRIRIVNHRISAELLVKFSAKYSSKQKAEIFDSLFKLLFELLESRWSFPARAPHLFLLFDLYELNIYKSDEIVKTLRESFKNSPLIFEYHLWLLFWFSPEIKKVDEHFYNRYFLYIKKNYNTSRTDDLYHDFFSNYETYSANDFSYLREIRHCQQPTDPFILALRHDDIDAFRSFAADPSFEIDQLIPNSFIEPAWILHYHPSPICYCAFYNAQKIFKYLLLSGADINFTDDVHRTLPQFSVCGGNIEIFRLCEQNKCDMKGTDHTSIAFHQYDLFLWLHEEKKTNLMDVHPMRGSALSRIFTEWNYDVLFYCIEKGTDFTAIDLSGEILLNYAAMFGSVELVRFLLSLNVFDVNKIYSSEVTCLSNAIMPRYPRIVDALIETPEINPCTTTLHGNSFEIAAEFGYTEILIKLCKKFHEKVNVTSIIKAATKSQSVATIKFVFEMFNNCQKENNSNSNRSNCNIKHNNDNSNSNDNNDNDDSENNENNNNDDSENNENNNNDKNGKSHTKYEINSIDRHWYEICLLHIVRNAILLGNIFLLQSIFEDMNLNESSITLIKKKFGLEEIVSEIDDTEIFDILYQNYIGENNEVETQSEISYLMLLEKLAKKKQNQKMAEHIRNILCSLHPSFVGS